MKIRPYSSIRIVTSDITHWLPILLTHRINTPSATLFLGSPEECLVKAPFSFSEHDFPIAVITVLGPSDVWPSLTWPMSERPTGAIGHFITGAHWCINHKKTHVSALDLIAEEAQGQFDSRREIHRNFLWKQNRNEGSQLQFVLYSETGDLSSNEVLTESVLICIRAQAQQKL